MILDMESKSSDNRTMKTLNRQIDLIADRSFIRLESIDNLSMGSINLPTIFRFGAGIFRSAVIARWVPAQLIEKPLSYLRNLSRKNVGDNVESTDKRPANFLKQPMEPIPALYHGRRNHPIFIRRSGIIIRCRECPFKENMQ